MKKRLLAKRTKQIRDFADGVSRYKPRALPTFDGKKKKAVSFKTKKPKAVKKPSTKKKAVK
jgi:hypothetical protein